MVGVAAGGADEAVKPAGARDVGRQRDRGRDFRRVWNAEEPITLMFDKGAYRTLKRTGAGLCSDCSGVGRTHGQCPITL